MTADIISFKKEKQKRGKKLGLCQHDIHKWKIWKNKQFDSKEGKLVTVYRCERCDAQKVKTH